MIQSISTKRMSRHEIFQRLSDLLGYQPKSSYKAKPVPTTLAIR